MTRPGGGPLLAFAAVAALVCGCATPPPASDPEALAEYRQNNDPMEPANRALYAVHDKIDTNVSAPVARGYRDWVPLAVRTHLSQFSDNLASPALLGDDMLQAKPRRAGDTLMRFLINTTLGVGGIFDPATGLGYPQHKSDFSVTLALWGVGPGPYVLIPVRGPSEARSIAGYPADFLLNPLTFAPSSAGLEAVNIGSQAVEKVDERAGLLDTVDNVKRTAIDPYATFRSLFHQHHEAEIEATRADTGATVPIWFPQPKN
jgi:phospholipid-binding lipoprotein MlaA